MNYSKNNFYRLSLRELSYHWYTAASTHTTGQRFTVSGKPEDSWSAFYPTSSKLKIDMAKKVDDKNTKKEILDAYAELAKEVQALSSEKKSLESKLSVASKAAVATLAASTTGASTPPPTPPTTPNTGAPAGGSGNNNSQPAAQRTYHVEDIIRIFETIREGFGSAVSELSGKLTKEASKLADIQKKSREVEAHLKELHGIEQLQDDTLAGLLEEYLDKSKVFAGELREKRETLEKSWSEKQKNWNKESEIHNQRIHDRDELLHKERRRDAEEYRYRLDTERKLSSDEQALKKKYWYAELEDRRHSKNKEWEAKEKEMSDREKEVAEAKTKAEELPDKLEKELKKVREETKGAIRRDAEIKANLLSREIEGLKKLNELKVNSMEDHIARQNVQLAGLRKQLTETLNQAKELAIKAIEGASGTRSFDAMREIALEQAKQQKNK